jgi:methionyl-tRNA formyltransferase
MHDKAALRSLAARDGCIYRAYFERVGAPPFDCSAKKVHHAPAINSVEVARQIDQARPEAIVISGTRLIRPPVIHCASRFGMVNMHTGLSPYYRGGPCTFWSLYNEEPEYAGATIHYLTEGIDSGDMILSARPDLEASDGVAALDCKVIDLGQQLMLQTLRLLEEGRAPRVPQWEKGRLFLYRQFTVPVRQELERKLQNGLMERCLRRLQERSPRLRIVSAEIGAVIDG